MSDFTIHALVPAAGGGTRFGGEAPKQYADLLGRPVLAHALDALCGHPGLRGVTVVIAAGDECFERMRSHWPPTVDTAVGGESRAESVLNGLEHIGEANPPDWVLVHDAARPCLARADIDHLLAAVHGNPDGAILALPVRDTLKRQDDRGRIGSTLPREGLWAAQTPQLFPFTALREALRDVRERGLEVTDEAQAMEHSGARPSLVPGSSGNIKVTWPGDLALVAAWLAARPGAGAQP